MKAIHPGKIERGTTVLYQMWSIRNELYNKRTYASKVLTTVGDKVNNWSYLQARNLKYNTPYAVLSRSRCAEHLL